MNVVLSLNGRGAALMAAILAGILSCAANPAQDGKDQVQRRTLAPPLSREAGNIEGVVTFRGEIPKSPVPDDAGVQRDVLHVDRETHGLRDVVVWLVAEKSNAEEKNSERALAPALMDQRDHEFVPRVLAVRAGQPVKFSNSDPANHNVRTSSPQRTNEFNIFTGADGSFTRRFVADPQQRPVRVGCDIHPWMRGWIYVFNHQWFSVTDERGRFQISSAPAGKYKLVLQQPDVRYDHERTITVSNAQTAKIQVEIHAEILPKEKSQP